MERGPEGQTRPGGSRLRAGRICDLAVRPGIRGDGQPRLSANAVLTTIRAIYLDIQGWAAQKPERWARWVTHCPIGSRETRSQAKTKRRAKERMDCRMRLLQPLLPAFVVAVTARRDHLHDLLNAATDDEPDQALTVGVKTYRRLFTVGDARHAECHGLANIRVLDESTGRNSTSPSRRTPRSGSGQPFRPCGPPGCVARSRWSYLN